MPLIVNINTMVYPQTAAAGYTQVAYLRDIDGNGVKVISRRIAASGTGNESFPSIYQQASPTAQKIPLMDKNTVVGIYRYNGGKNPYIVIRDKKADPAIDYYSYQGNTSIDITDQKELLTAKKYATDHEYNTITPDLYGKRVIIRGLTGWNDTDKSFNVIAADDNDPFKTIKLRVGTSTTCALGTLTTLPTLSADKVYDAKAILEYDPDANDGNGEYFLAPMGFFEQFDIPKLTYPATIKDKIKYLTAEDGTTVIGAEYTDDFKDGSINLEFQIDKPTTGTVPSYYYWSIDKEGGSNVLGSPNSVNISNTTFKPSFKTTQLKFDEETGSATIYAYCYAKDIFNNSNTGRRFKIVIRDAVQNGRR